MTGVALKGLLGRKLRTVLTALAIILGVAMISGTYILTDTITRGVHDDRRQVVRELGRRHQRQGRVQEHEQQHRSRPRRSRLPC